jgi:hypothetical protein
MGNWRKLDNKELHSIHLLSDIVRLIISVTLFAA